LKKFGLGGKNLAAQDPITLEAIRKNQVRQAKLGISSPTVSLLASAGHGNIAKNTTTNGGNITVNVAGSVVSQGDLISGIKDGLVTLARRRGASGFSVL
jgi:regulator of RNase E activity RraA